MAHNPILLRRTHVFRARTVNKEGTKRDIIVLGASAGGVMVLQQLFSELSNDMTAVIAVVQAISPSYQPSSHIAASGWICARGGVRHTDVFGHRSMKNPSKARPGGVFSYALQAA